MLRLTMPYAQAWNSWFADVGNRPDGVARLRAVVDEACRDVGRDAAEIDRTVAVLVQGPGGTGRLQGNDAHGVIPPLEGPPEVVAESLRAYARAGISHVQLVLDPITLDGIRAVAPVLRELDRR
jgi:alkanesulfonate monooxygenase SsuD/methylene tetrahydromethanopterin reductase-like flavin-dependent oxidoreductase (luciferase family)